MDIIFRKLVDRGEVFGEHRSFLDPPEVAYKVQRGFLRNAEEKKLWLQTQVT